MNKIAVMITFILIFSWTNGVAYADNSGRHSSSNGKGFSQGKGHVNHKGKGLGHEKSSVPTPPVVPPKTPSISVSPVVSSSSSSSVANTHNISVPVYDEASSGSTVSSSTQIISEDSLSSGNMPIYYPGPLHNTESVSIATPFGGLGVANSEEYEKVQTRIESIVILNMHGLITDEMAQRHIADALEQLDLSTEEQRFFGIGYRCNGKNLFTGLGLLCN